MVDIHVGWQVGVFGVTVAALIVAVTVAAHVAVGWVCAVAHRQARLRRERRERMAAREDGRFVDALADALAEGAYRAGLRGST